jgi:MFS family permease
VISKSFIDKAYPYRYFLLCLLCVFLMGMGEGGFLVIVVGYLENQQLSLSMIGLAMAFLSCVEGISNLLTGFLYQGHHEKKFIQTAALLLAVGCFLFVIQPEGLMIGLAIAINAAGTGILTVMIYTTAQQHLPRSTSTGFAVGLYTSCIALGMAIGSPLVGVLTDTSGYPTAFAVCGMIILGIYLAASALPRNEGIGQMPVPGPLALHKLKETFNLKLISGPVMRVGVASAFTMASSISIFSTLFPIYGLRSGFSYTTIGTLMGLNNMLAGIIRPVCGYILTSESTDRINTAGVVSLTLAISILPFTGLGWGLTLLVALIGLAFGTSRVTSMTLVVEGKKNPSDISKRLSLYNAFMTVGHIIGPFIAGIVAGWIGLSLALAIVPGALFLVFIITRLSRSSTKGPGFVLENQ